jgi:hypothetical protein
MNTIAIFGGHLGIVSVADDVSFFTGIHRGMRHTLNPVSPLPFLW